MAGALRPKPRMTVEVRTVLTSVNRKTAVYVRDSLAATGTVDAGALDALREIGMGVLDGSKRSGEYVTAVLQHDGPYRWVLHHADHRVPFPAVRVVLFTPTPNWRAAALEAFGPDLAWNTGEPVAVPAVEDDQADEPAVAL